MDIFDHFGGLGGFAEKRSKPITVYAHPDAFYPKLVVTPAGKRGPWICEKEELGKKGVVWIEERLPTVVNDFFLISGEIERTTDFEKPWPAARVIKGGKEVQDLFIDEQVLGVLVEGKGLIVVSGCSHPGIVNIVKHMHNLTQERILAVIGGFHLSVLDKDTIEKTIDGIAAFEPELVVPCHCTGFHPSCMLASRFGDKFAINSVGTVIEF